MSCNTAITGGITRDCITINSAVGVDKDLVLVNYDDVDVTGTKASGNVEADDTNLNIGGLTAILLKVGTTQYTFEGTDYSVVPNVTSELRDDGDTWYVHSIAFTVFSKRAKDRVILEDLGGSRVIAIAKDRSTGLYEIFGLDQGLKVSAIERAYVGSQNSNFYSVTLATPDVAVVKESGLAKLAVSITTAI